MKSSNESQKEAIYEQYPLLEVFDSEGLDKLYDLVSNTTTPDINYINAIERLKELTREVGD